MGTAPNWGTSFGRQQAGVSAGPCLGHKPHQQQHQGVFGVEGQVYDTTSFLDVPQSLLEKRLVFRSYSQDTGTESLQAVNRTGDKPSVPW